MIEDIIENIMKEVIQKGNPILRKKASKVAPEDITGDGIQSLLKDMSETLREKKYGVALAAPQIGTSVRIFILAERIFTEEEHKKNGLVYINPKIIKTSRKKAEVEEACLSVDGYFGTVKRAALVTVEAYNEHGNMFTRGAGGLLAQIFQHEIDHLNGILYTDHAHNVQKVEDEKSTKNQDDQLGT